MTFNDIQFIFNRSWAHTFNRKKLLLTSAILLLMGILVVFCRGLAINATTWVVMSLMFLPVFLSSGILLALGVLLIRIYHDEIKKKPISYSATLDKSWEVILGASYFAVPMILIYLLLWMLLGIFFLFSEIPLIGDFFAAILILGPYLINLGSLILCILSLSLLFFVTPIIALKGLNRRLVSDILERRFQNNLFANLILATIATLPLLLTMGLLILASFLTETICFTCEKPLYNVIQWFFIMLPFAVFLSPTFIYFFNFAAESHVLLMQEVRRGAAAGGASPSRTLPT